MEVEVEVETVVVEEVVEGVVCLSTYWVWKTDLSTQAKVSLSGRCWWSTPLQTDFSPSPEGEAVKVQVEYP